MLRSHGALTVNRTPIPGVQNPCITVIRSRHTLFDGLISCSSVLTALNLCQRFPPSTPLSYFQPSIPAVNSFHQTVRNFSLLPQAHRVASVSFISPAVGTLHVSKPCQWAISVPSSVASSAHGFERIVCYLRFTQNRGQAALMRP